MASYDTLRETRRDFGKNGYIEVSRKRLVEAGETTEFVLVTRGFVDGQGVRRWTRFVTLPDDAELRAWLAAAVQEI